jgi:hypothetical protein
MARDDMRDYDKMSTDELVEFLGDGADPSMGRDELVRMAKEREIR